MYKLMIQEPEPTVIRQHGPTQRATSWLVALDAALAAGHTAAVLALFDDGECFWRDMVAFTWNIKTMEGKHEIARFLDATLDTIKPNNFRLDGDAREQDGAIEAKFAF